ncbi:SEL1-like repeat protein [Myxococcota bacterium]|nr:SEL1-like repeat protein [Myxococcota bacterium]
MILKIHRVLPLLPVLLVFAGCHKKSPGTSPSKGAVCQDLSPAQCFTRGLKLEKEGDPLFWDYLRSACDKGDSSACQVVIGRIDEKVKSGIKDDGQIEILRTMATGYCQRGHAWACSIKYRIFSNNMDKKREEVKLAMAYHQKRCREGGVIECKELLDLLPMVRVVFRQTYTVTQLEINTLACERGYGEGCYNIGWENWRKRRFDRAFEVYSKACTFGNALGCTAYVSNVRNAVVNGFGDYQSKNVALKTLCDGDNLEACHLLGKGHLKGWWHRSDAVQGAAYLTKACLASHFASCDALAQCFLGGRGVKRDPRKAFLMLTKSCADGQNRSCVALAEGERQGLFGDKSVQKAVDILRATCKSNRQYTRPSYGRYRRRYYNDYYYFNSPACGMLGNYVVKNLTNAYSAYNGERFMTNACSKGHQRYCFLVAKYFHRIKRSSYYYLYRFKSACDAGIVESCQTLYGIYSRGDGLPKSESLAREFKGKACRLDPSLKLCK